MQSQENAPVNVFIGIGSNMGSRIKNLAFAVHGLEELAVDHRVTCSPVYETDPVGYTDQDRFLNMVAELRTNLSPVELLMELHALEQQAFRTREIRYGPRTLDLDILLYGNYEVADEGLIVPHPRLEERAFVVLPLCDLAPNWILPTGQSVAALAAQFSEEGGVRYVGRFW